MCAVCRFWLGQIFYFFFDGNNLHGVLTAEAAQYLEISGTNNPLMRATLSNSSDDSMPAVVYPAFISLDNSTMLQQNGKFMSCPLIVPGVGNLVSLSLDPVYLAYQHCTCLTGYAIQQDVDFTEPSTIYCVPCPDHLNCSSAVFNPQHHVADGYYPWPINPSLYNNNSLALVSATMVACVPQSLCVPHTPGVVELACREGHDVNSFLCSRCESGYFVWHGYCESCGSNPHALWVTPLIIILVSTAVLVAAIYYFTREEQIKYYSQPGQQPAAETTRLVRLTRSFSSHIGSPIGAFLALHSPRWRSWHEPPTPEASDAKARLAAERQQLATEMQAQMIGSQSWAFVDIIVFWYQTSSVLQSLNYGDTTPAADTGSSLADESTVGSVLRFSPFGFECIFTRMDFNTYFWLILFSPLWLAGVTWLLCLLNVLCHKLAVRIGRADGWLTTWVYVRAAFRLLFLLLSFVYMQVAISCFQVWRCESIGGHMYLLAAPYVACHTPQWDAQAFFACVMFLLFNFGLLAFVGYSMFFYESRASHTAEQAAHRLREDYINRNSWRTASTLFIQDQANKLSDGARMWQVVVLGRKLVLTSIVYLVSNTSLAIPVTVLLLLFILVAMQAWYQPYRRFVDNVLESVLVILLATEFLVSILVGQAALENDRATQDAMSTLNRAIGWIGVAFVCLVLIGHVLLYFAWTRVRIGYMFRDRLPKLYDVGWSWLNSQSHPRPVHAMSLSGSSSDDSLIKPSVSTVALATAPATPDHKSLDDLQPVGLSVDDSAQTAAHIAVGPAPQLLSRRDMLLMLASNALSSRTAAPAVPPQQQQQQPQQPQHQHHQQWQQQQHQQQQHCATPSNAPVDDPYAEYADHPVVLS